MRRVLNTAEDVSPEVWAEPGGPGRRGIGETLVHALDTHARWRSSWQGQTNSPQADVNPLLSVAELRTRWESEWVALDMYLADLDEDGPNRVWNGLPLWQSMVHVVNHGTQHRSEAAALLTAAGHPTGDLDYEDYLGESTD